MKLEMKMPLKLRPYQKEIVDDPAPYKSVRGARRVGKTTILASEILRYDKVGIYTPINAMTGIVYDYLDTCGLKALDKARFYTGQIETMRGSEYDLIAVDEAGYVDDDELYELYEMAKLNEADFIMVGTPPMRDDSAFQVLSESNNFKHWHLPSNLSPNWSDELDQEMKDAYGTAAYSLEILAEWYPDAEA